jgi:chromosome segregation ATPase
MTDNLTQKLPPSNGETLRLILTSVDDLRVQLSETNQRLSKLEDKLDERLQDTRPMWGKINADIEQLQKGQSALQQNFLELQKGQAELQQGFVGLQNGQAELQKNQSEFQQSLVELQKGQLQLQEDVKFVRTESKEVRTLLRDIFRRLSIFNDTLVTMQADYRDIYDRVRGLELRGT